MKAASAPRAIPTILVVALSGFLMGFDGSLFTGAVIFIEREFTLSEREVGWAVASLTLAATLSIFTAGPLADRVGRRAVLRMATVMFAVSAILAAVATNLTTLIVARMLSGLGVGAVLIAAPLYIAEIAPAALRGRMVSFNQLFIVFGISAAFLSNYVVLRLGESDAGWLAAFNLADWNWRWMLGIGALPAVIYLFALLAIPESPRWLAMHGRVDAARRVLARAHGEAMAEAELAEVRTSLAREKDKSDARLRDLWAPELRGVLAIGLVVGILQQITGINTVLAYATVIFERAGAGANASFMQTVFVGLVNLVFTLFALLLIDRVGRRPLLLAGTAGIAVSMLLTAYGFHAADGAMNPKLVLGGMLGFVASFAISLGPVMWVLLSEIFPNRVRGLAISFVGLINSGVCFLVQLMFPWQLEVLGNAVTFLIYAVFALLGLGLLAKMLPETRGRSLEEIEDSLVRHA